MPKADRHKPRVQIYVSPETAGQVRTLAPTSTLSRVTEEALQEWIAERQRRAALLAEAEANKKPGSG